MVPGKNTGGDNSLSTTICYASVLLQLPSERPVVLLGSGQYPGWPQCWTIPWRRAGSSVMIPSTPAPTRVQRSLFSLIVQTINACAPGAGVWR
jgi:hypothetical protein